MPRSGLDSETVVRAAAQLADSEGLAAVTLARLAKDLNVRAPSLYVHVNGLPDLQRRLAARGARELGDAIQAAAAGRSGQDALQAVADVYRAYARAHPGTYAALQRASHVEALDDADRLVGVMLAVLRGYGLEDEDAIHGVRGVRAALHGF